MSSAAKTLAASLTAALLLGETVQSASGSFFRRVSLPTEYWQPMADQSLASGMNTRQTCTVACDEAGADTCHGFEFDPASTPSCVMGSVAVPASVTTNYFPEYVLNPKRIYLRSELYRYKALTGVVHLAGLRNTLGDDAAFNRSESDFPPIDIPPALDLPFGEVMTLSYRKGFLQCGGRSSASTAVDNKDKKCRQFSFKHGEWRVIGGDAEMITAHGDGAGVMLGGRLWVFSGWDDNHVATNAAETYSFETNKWESIQSVPFWGPVVAPAVTAISDTEILVTNGVVPGCCYNKEAFVFDTVTRTWSDNRGAQDTGHSNGLVDFKCGRKTGEPVAVCTGGGNEWIGETKRTHFFNISARAWLPYDPANDLPNGGGGDLVNLGDRLFMPQRGGNNVLEYMGFGASPLWVEVPNTALGCFWRNAFYTMDYNELLV